MAQHPDAPVITQPMPVPSVSHIAQVQPIQPGQMVVQHIQVTTNPMMPRGPPRDWSSGLFSCCDDMTICLCSTFVPCYECMLAVDMGESCCVPWCVPGAAIAMRGAVRNRHNIQGDLLNDCVCMTCCGTFALCQLGREVRNIKHGKAVP